MCEPELYGIGDRVFSARVNRRGLDYGCFLFFEYRFSKLTDWSFLALMISLRTSRKGVSDASLFLSLCAPHNKEALHAGLPNGSFLVHGGVLLEDSDECA